MTESPFKKFEEDLHDIEEKDLIFSIWIKPKITLEYIVKKCPKKYVTILLVLGGVVNAIDRASTRNLGEIYSTIEVLAIAFITGALFGWIGYYIYAWALSATGNWIKGSAEPSEFRTVIAWSLIPSICTLVLVAPELAIFGDDLFKSVLSNDSEIYTISLMAFGALELILSLWSLVILIVGIKIIQKFSTGMAILNMFLPVLVIIVPIGIVVLSFR